MPKPTVGVVEASETVSDAKNVLTIFHIKKVPNGDWSVSLNSVRVGTCFDYKTAQEAMKWLRETKQKSLAGFNYTDR